MCHGKKWRFDSFRLWTNQKTGSVPSVSLYIFRLGFSPLFQIRRDLPTVPNRFFAKDTFMQAKFLQNEFSWKMQGRAKERERAGEEAADNEGNNFQCY